MNRSGDVQFMESSQFTQEPKEKMIDREMELRCIFFLFRPLLPFICFCKHWIFFRKETLFPFNIHMMRVNNI